MIETGKVATEAFTVFAQIAGCRVCDSPLLDTVLDLGSQPIVAFPQSPSAGYVAPLEMVRCGACGTAQLLHTVRDDLLWGDEYWYRSGMNATMRDALLDVVKQGVAIHQEGVWLDIGANDGCLLDQVPPGFEKIPCEPARPFHDILRAKYPRLIDRPFSATVAADLKGKCSVITSCAMFYDVEDPQAFIRAVAGCLRPGGVWINQFTDLEDMLRMNAFDSICHEHRIYYDPRVVANLYAQQGFEITSLTRNSVNGGSVRVEARLGTPGPALDDRITGLQLKVFAGRVKRWRDSTREILEAIPSGNLWCYGASTKGICILSYLGIADRFRGVADRNPEKHGRYMPGSALRITDEAEMRESKPYWLFVLPWAFKNEFVQREKELIESGTRMIFPLPNMEVVA